MILLLSFRICASWCRCPFVWMACRRDACRRDGSLRRQQRHHMKEWTKMSTPGVEPGLSRPQRDVLTTRRCGLLCLAHPSDPGKDLASFPGGFLFVREWWCCRKVGMSDGISFCAPPANGGVQPLPCSLSGDVLSVGLVV